MCNPTHKTKPKVFIMKTPIETRILKNSKKIKEPKVQNISKVDIV